MNPEELDDIHNMTTDRLHKDVEYNYSRLAKQAAFIDIEWAHRHGFGMSPEEADRVREEIKALEDELLRRYVPLQQPT